MNAGQFIGSEEILSGDEFSLYNPANNEPCGSLYYATQSHIEQAVQNAASAQKAWWSLAPAERSRLLHKLTDLIRQENDRLAGIDSLQAGKPIQETVGYDIESGAEAIEFFANAAAGIRGQSYQLGKVKALVQPEPYGVTLGIGAWNYPFQIAAWKLAPALAAGNAMIFKPSEFTPSSAVELAKLCLEAGLPSGLFQVIQGDGKVASELVNNAQVRKVSLTGSVPTGKKVMRTAAEGLKPVTLELGGKGPLVIFSDADLKSAVSASMLANFYTQGEICSNGTRVFVEESIYDNFMASLKERIKNISIGNPADPATQMGPLISKNHYQKVMNYIQSGIDEGAELFYGGKFPESLQNSPWENGNFVEPTVFTNCQDSMKIVEEEIFGPVMSVLKFKTEEEVLERANATSYGLAGAVFTDNIKRAFRVSENLEVGVCWINNYNVTPVELPFGGVKDSGIGRENAIETLYSYTQSKTIYIEPDNLEYPY